LLVIYHDEEFNIIFTFLGLIMEPTQFDMFFQMITYRFGKNYTTLMKLWINNKKKICTANQQLIFLRRCRSYDLIPSHINKLKVNITFYSSSVNHIFEKTTKEYRYRLLNLEIKDLNFNLKYLRVSVERIEKSILSKVYHVI